MSGMNSPITVLTAPYNVINNSKVVSLDTQFLPNSIKEINQTPNYDLISNPIKPKETLENFASDLKSRVASKSEVASKIPSRSEVASKIQSKTEQESNLVSDSLVDTALSDYLYSKDDYYDNKNEMVDNTLPYNPLKQLVKNYLEDNISMYDNRGKYFDQYLFNKKFDAYIEEQQKLNLTKQKVRLSDLNKISNLEIKPYQLPLNKILINIKNVSFDIFDDILNGKNPSDKIKGDNLFYIGILCITITILYITIAFIFD
jgi:hypothetical protein